MKFFILYGVYAGNSFPANSDGMSPKFQIPVKSDDEFQRIKLIIRNGKAYRFEGTYSFGKGLKYFFEVQDAYFFNEDDYL